MDRELDIAQVKADADRVLAEELYWFPVRHHSPAVARHVRAAIRARKPKLVLIEGPAHANELIPHVVDAKTKPPIALYSSYRDDDNTLGLAGIASAAPDIPPRFPVWYPMLAYSPEYVAIKEASAIGATALFMDLPSHGLIKPNTAPVATPMPEEDDDEASDDETEDDEAEDDQEDSVEPTAAAPSWESFVVESDFYKTMARVAGYRTWDEGWDSMFEIGHRHATYEEFRRDLAYFCAAVRATTPAERMAHDGTRERERFMLRTIRAEVAKRKVKPADVMIVCGGFHLFLDRDDAEAPPELPSGTVFATVVPYSYFRVSELAGYGAANRAPKYYEKVWDHGEARGEDEPWVAAMIDHVTAVLGRGRKDGELLSAADAISVTQHARMLASLRGRPAPILDDIRDALISCCCKGRPEEEGRHLLAAMTGTEIGNAVGRVTPALGRMPIVHDFYAQLDALDLGDVMGKDKRTVVTLDLREAQASARSAFLHRVVKLDVPLATLEGRTDSGATLFREKWRLEWSPKTEVALIEKNLYGDTIEAAAMAQLEEDVAKEQRQAGATCARLLESVTMQLPHLVNKLQAAAGAAVDEDRLFGSQCQALGHLLVLDRLAMQRDLGRDAIASLATRSYTRACLGIGDLGAIPVDQQEQTIGYLKSLAEAVLAPRDGMELDRALFSDSVKSAAVATDVPFMQGAYAGLLTELREIDPADLAARVAQFAKSHPTKMVLAGEFLDGAFAVSKTSMLLGAEALVSAIDELLRAAPWEDFMTLLPKVRNAFERLHERQRLAFADRVAARYQLSSTEQISELPVTSAGAAAYLATIDARVAAIMKEWSF